jgi:hypothetical protein
MPTMNLKVLELSILAAENVSNRSGLDVNALDRHRGRHERFKRG